MSRIVAFMRDLVAKGMSWEDAAAFGERFEDSLEEVTASAIAPLADRSQTPGAQRTRKWREKNEAKKAADHHGDVTVTRHGDNHGDVTSSCARVRDITSNSEITGSVVAVVERERAPQSDDWPKGDARAHAKLLIAEIGSPWLDPNKSLDLNTTTGRIAAWKRDGASWQFDVLPVVAKLCANRRSRVLSWKFFDGAIGQSIADNRAALAIPEAQARATGPPNSLTDRMADERRRAEALAFEMLDAQNG